LCPKRRCVHGQADGFRDGGDDEANGEGKEERDFFVGSSLDVPQKWRHELPVCEDDGNKQEQILADFPRHRGVARSTGARQSGKKNGQDDDGEVLDGVSAIIMRPTTEESSPRSTRRRMRTMVLATAMRQPTATPRKSGQPMSSPTPMPSPIDRRIPSEAPNTATHFTYRSSGIENSMPMENMRSNDADFGHDLKGMDVMNAKAGSKRTEKEAGTHIAQDGRLAQTPRNHAEQERACENHGDFAKDEAVGQ